ncbi:hypothetical protein [Streptomyces sp. NPDC001530]|uniref:hypothetical protein n=1 Tax=Streptomyces sp. NPDC001530 TaxID=3364582 RepID=UPI0036A26315
MLLERAEDGDAHAATEAATLPRVRGEVGRAVKLLTQLADEGGGYAARGPAELLGATGRLDELRTRAETAEPRAAHTPARLLLKQGEFDEAFRLSDQAQSSTLHGEIVDALVAHGDADRRTAPHGEGRRR